MIMREKNKKICVVCGRSFDCPPSDKTVTCSKECSRINKSRTHKDKSNSWTTESRQKLKDLGQTDNLKLGTEAAKKSPKSGRFTTNINAIDWHLISPEGQHYYFHSLNFWLRENCRELFGVEPDSRGFLNARSGLSGAKRAMLGGKYGCTTYKGWKVMPTETDRPKMNKIMRSCNNDIVGQKFDKLTAVKRAGKDKTGRALWLCKCDCGNTITATITDLRAGRKKSCGCLKKERYNIIGQRFGRLVVIKKECSGTHAKFLCQCDCGKQIIVRGDSLQSGKTVSCGCEKKTKIKAEQLKDGRKLQDHTSDIFFKGTISKNNTSGINGVTRLKNGKYRAYIGYKNKPYSILEDYDINVAKAAREEAEKAVKENNFDEWINALKKEKQSCEK